MSDESDTASGDEIQPDPETRDFLRDVADELRGESGESQQVAAMVYRVSDVYDEDEDTDPRDVYVNMRTILRVKERGKENLDPEGL